MLKTFTVSDRNVTDDLLMPLKYNNLERFEVQLNNSDLKREAT